MANNDYNYYKSEYSKFKGNYYTPGSNNNNNKDEKKKAVKRFFRALLVFVITFGIIAAAVYGGIKLYRNIADNKEKNTTAATTVEESTSEKKTEKSTEKTTEKATEPETTQPETTESSTPSKVVAGSTGYIKTPDSSGVYLRYSPTYDVAGYAHLSDGTEVKISEISSDGQWAKTSNFDINGWIFMKYIVTTSSAPADKSTSSSVKTSSSDSSENLTFGQALTIFGNDTSRNLYMNCKINSISSVSGIADYQDSDSKVIATFSNGQDVPIYSVRSGYGKTRVNGVETWIPTQYLDFVSWGHYR